MKKLFVFALLFFVVGCSTIAPMYNTDFNNISKMRKEKLNQVKVASVTKETAATEDVDSLKIRLGTYESPNGTFTAYLEEALKQELNDAQLLNQNSQIEVSAVLLKNILDAQIIIGFAEISARFIVRNAGVVSYEKIKTARYTWDSSYLGSIAIPKAQQNYPIVVQKLIGSLFSDSDFISALR